MKIVVAVKPVPEAEARLRASADGTTLDPEGVKFVLAGYDESSVEQALLLKEAHAPSTVRAVSMGPAARSEEVARACLALGCDEASVVDADLGTLGDPLAVARGLASVLAPGSFDLVLVGKQAGDDEEGLVGPALAERLRAPHAGFVTDLSFDAARGIVRYRRASERGDERWEASLPLVVSLQQAGNDPRTAKLPAILKSRRSTVAHHDGAPALVSATGSRPISFALPAPRTGARMIEYTTPTEAAEKLVRLLKEEAKVFP